ncbi:hypothetical protein LguiB_030323 [Lonicera macranthoides]
MRRTCLVGWEPSAKTLYELNTDGSYSSSTKTAGIGAIIRKMVSLLVLLLLT